MKNKIFGFMFLTVLIFTTVVRIDIVKKSFGSLVFANAEALANGEENLDYYPSYINETKIIRNYQGNISVEIGDDAIAPDVSITINASGSLNYCKYKRNESKKCYKEMLGFTPFS